MTKSLVAAFAIYAASAVATAAATFNITGSFSGGQMGDVAFDITIDADFTSDISDTSAGLTVHSLTSSVFPGLDPFAVAGGLGYSYLSSQDILGIGGLSTNIFDLSFGGGATTDFYFQINDFLASPSVAGAGDSLANVLYASTRLSGDVTVSAVPVPASLPLALLGIAGFAGLRMRARKT